MINKRWVAGLDSAIFWYGCIFAFIFFEYLLFASYALHEVTNYYPRSFDQAEYLSQSYAAYQNILQNGFLAELKSHISPVSSIFYTQAATFFLIFGPSRLMALSINFIYFALLQLALVKSVKDVTGSWFLTVFALGLLLSVNTTFFWAGGLLDFRIDFMAFCLFGIFICCCVRSNLFLDRKWSIIAAVVSVYLILLRHITVCYILSILLATFLMFILLAYIYKNEEKFLLKNRFKNIILLTGIVAAGVLPFLWMSRKAIYNYYIVNHVINNEKYIRAFQEGVVDFFSNIKYYPASILENHIGKGAVIIVLISISFALCLRYLQKFVIKCGPEIKKCSLTCPLFIFLLSCIFLPISILTIDLSKSPIVGNIVIVPFIWLVVLCIYCINKKGRFFNFFLFTIAILTFAFGTYSYVKFMHKRSDRAQLENLTKITRMYLDVGSYFVAHNKNNLVYSSDQIVDYLIPQDLTVLYYENYGVLLNPVGSMLGVNNLYEISEDNAMAELHKSNIFIVNLDSYPTYATDYPFNISMNKIRYDLIDVSNQDMQVLGEYTFNDHKFRVYVKLE